MAWHTLKDLGDMHPRFPIDLTLTAKNLASVTSASRSTGASTSASAKKRRRKCSVETNYTGSTVRNLMTNFSDVEDEDESSQDDANDTKFCDDESDN